MYQVEHKPSESRFVVVDDGKESSLDYKRSNGTIRFQHTFVPPDRRKRGIAESMTRHALAYAREHELKVVPACSYVRHFIDEHDEYQSLVASGDQDETNPATDHDSHLGHDHADDAESASRDQNDWMATYKPLLIIAAYLVGGTLLTALVTGGWGWMSMMGTFMGLFFVVFSFFKMLDLKGFCEAYTSYDLIAARWQPWGYIYPFVELGLGILFLTSAAPVVACAVALIVMGVSSIGVINAVARGRDLQCGCLGTMFDLPMSTVTIVEDVTMVLMAALMLTGFAAG